MPRILLKGEKKVVAQGIPKMLFFKGGYEVSPDSDVLEVVPSKKMGGLPAALWQVHSVETGQGGVVASSCILSTRRSVNIVVSDPGITGTRLQRPDKNGVWQLLVSRSGAVVASQLRTIKNKCFKIRQL